jgi:IMP dehydrogenase/GMP reductase
MSENKNEGGEKRVRVSDEQFVEVWTETALNGGTVGEVAEKLGLQAASASVRATTLRKALREQADVELPKMKRRSRVSQKDFGKLADIIRQKQQAIEAIAAADEADAEA